MEPFVHTKKIIPKEQFYPRKRTILFQNNNFIPKEQFYSKRIILFQRNNFITREQVSTKEKYLQKRSIYKREVCPQMDKSGKKLKV